MKNNKQIAYLLTVLLKDGFLKKGYCICIKYLNSLKGYNNYRTLFVKRENLESFDFNKYNNPNTVG